MTLSRSCQLVGLCIGGIAFEDARLFLRPPLIKRCLPFRGDTLAFCLLLGGKL
jgi:hypothetical protein